MTNVSSIIGQLKRERDRVEHQLKGLNAALMAFANIYRMPRRERHRMSLAGRKKIAAAQRARLLLSGPSRGYLLSGSFFTEKTEFNALYNSTPRAKLYGKRVFNLSIPPEAITSCCVSATGIQ